LICVAYISYDINYSTCQYIKERPASRPASQVALIKLIKSFCFSWIHGILLFKSARNWASIGVIHYFWFFFRRKAASSNNLFWQFVYLYRIFAQIILYFNPPLSYLTIVFCLFSGGVVFVKPPGGHQLTRRSIDLAAHAYYKADDWVDSPLPSQGLGLRLP
jgi:hypothetical protein